MWSIPSANLPPSGLRQKSPKPQGAPLLHTIIRFMRITPIIFRPTGFREKGGGRFQPAGAWQSGRSHRADRQGKAAAGRLRGETAHLDGSSGIDCARFRKARRERKERPAGASLRLLFLGRLAREKNLEELLIWMAGSRGKNYHLLAGGRRPPQAGAGGLAGRLGLYGRVEFAGMVPPEQTAFWYQKGDVFVCASRSETQGLTYLEALAAGTSGCVPGGRLPGRGYRKRPKRLAVPEPQPVF